MPEEATIEQPAREGKPSQRFGASFAEAMKPFENELKAGAAAGTPSPPDRPAPQSATPPPAPKAEPEKEIEPKVEAAVDPDEEIISRRRSPKWDDFHRVKTSAKEAAKERDELKAKWEASEKELEPLRKAPKHNAELISKLEKERDDFKGKYEAFIVQFTPEFQAKFDGQIANVVAALKGVVPETEAGKLAELMQLPDSDAKRRAIGEITESLDQFQIAEVVAANREVRRINADRKEAVSKANQTLTSIASDRQKQAEEAKTRMTAVFDETLSKVAHGDKAIPVYQPREGDAEWNKGVAERTSVAKAMFHGQFENEFDRAEAAMWAAAAPGILADYNATVTAKDAEIASLKETVTKLQVANPGINGGVSGNQQGKSGPIRGSFKRAMAAGLGQ